MINNIKFYIMHNKLLKKTFQPFYRFFKLPGKVMKNVLFRKNAMGVLTAMKSALDSDGVIFWLEFGTLLGAHREKNFISHDLDIDIGLFLENDVLKIEESILNKGFTKVRQIEIDHGEYGIEQTYIMNGVSIDLFYFSKKGQQMFCHSFCSEYGKSFDDTILELGGLIPYEHSFPYGGFINSEFLGLEIMIPKNIHEHLSAQYGEGYMIKDKNWNGYTKPRNITILKNKLGVKC